MKKIILIFLFALLNHSAYAQLQLRFEYSNDEIIFNDLNNLNAFSTDIIFQLDWYFDLPEYATHINIIRCAF